MFRAIAFGILGLVFVVSIASSIPADKTSNSLNDGLMQESFQPSQNKKYVLLPKALHEVNLNELEDLRPLLPQGEAFNNDFLYRAKRSPKKAKKGKSKPPPEDADKGADAAARRQMKKVHP